MITCPSTSFCKWINYSPQGGCKHGLSQDKARVQLQQPTNTLTLQCLKVGVLPSYAPWPKAESARCRGRRRPSCHVSDTHHRKTNTMQTVPKVFKFPPWNKARHFPFIVLAKTRHMFKGEKAHIILQALKRMKPCIFLSCNKYHNSR